jgi:hypothetical protein
MDVADNNADAHDDDGGIRNGGRTDSRNGGDDDGIRRYMAYNRPDSRRRTFVLNLPTYSLLCTGLSIRYGKYKNMFVREPITGKVFS